MPSLRELLAAHDSLLVIDGSSAVVQVGWLERSSDIAQPLRARWHTSAEEAGIGIFRGIESLAMPPRQAGAWIFCDGPGSVLGIRTSATALRTWGVLHTRPVFAFHSLAVVAHALGRADLTIIADARRETWHCATINSSLRRLSSAELSGELVMPESFRHWSQLPPGVRLTPYALAELLPRVIDADIFRLTPAPDAFLHDEPSYATWTPQVHRAP